MTDEPHPHLRPRDGTPQPTTAVELLFDLVYAFAVTQVSHLLIGDLSLTGAGHAAFLLVVVWWAWIYTTWMVNWFDPASSKVRLGFALWGPALALELAGPIAGYWTPGRGTSRTMDYPVDGGHFAERFQSFLIIVLGESIIVTGATARRRECSATSPKYSHHRPPVIRNATASAATLIGVSPRALSHDRVAQPQASVHGARTVRHRDRRPTASGTCARRIGRCGAHRLGGTGIRRATRRVSQ